MATLTIGKKSVTVDDSFRSLSPADQQKTVDEIAKAIGADAPSAPVAPGPQQMATPPDGLTPGSREYADWAATQARAGMTLPPAGPQPGAGMLHDKFRDGPQQPVEQPQLVNNPFASPLPGPLGQLHNTVQAVNAGGLNSSLFNLGQEAYAGVMGVPKAIMDASQGKGFDYPRAFKDELALSEQTEAQKRALNPQAYDTGGNIGTIAMLGKAPGKGIAAGLLSTAAKGTVKRAALQSGTVGFATGFGQPGDIGTRLTNGTEQGATAALLGAGAGKVATLLDGAPAATPKVQQLFDEAKGWFRSARQSGAQISQTATKNISSGLRQVMDDEGLITPSGKIADYPKAKYALDLAEDYASAPSITMEQAYRLRKAVGKVAGSADREERGLGVQMIRKLDSTVESLTDANGGFVAGGAGSGEQAVADWAKGRQLWHIASKGQDVEGLITAAKRQSQKSAATPVEQATRNKFDAFVSKDKNLRGFSPDEQAALRRVGDGTRVGNFAKGAGRLAPTTLASLGLKGGIPFAVGNAIGGPVVGGTLAGATLGTGLVGRIVSNLSTASQAELARVLVLNGGKLPKAVPSSLSSPVKKALGNLMIIGASKTGGLNQTVANEIGGWMTSLTGQPAAQ